MYGSDSDMKNDTSRWMFCNFDDSTIAFPRHCGPSAAVGFQWYPSKPSNFFVLDIIWATMGACPTGSFSIAGAAVCTACPSGTFNSQVGQSVCKACPSGRFTSGTGSAVCAPLLLSSLQVATGSYFQQASFTVPGNNDVYTRWSTQIVDMSRDFVVQFAARSQNDIHCSLLPQQVASSTQGWEFVIGGWYAAWIFLVIWLHGVLFPRLAF